MEEHLMSNNQTATPEHTQGTEPKDMPAEAKTPRLPSNPNKAMQQMMGTIDALREQMIAETDALKTSNTSLFMDLQDDKIIVARTYLDGMKELLSRSDELKGADPALKERLEVSRNEFAVVAKENLDALKKMSGGMKRLEGRIIQAARKEADKENKFAYGANGYLQNGVASRIGINESV